MGPHNLDVIDVSGGGTSPDFLRSLASRSEGLKLYGKDQVIAIVRDYHVPHQVDQHNNFIRGHISGVNFYNLLGESETTPEDVMDAALTAAGELYDSYASLPPGSLYTHLNKPFSDTDTHEDVRKDGSPHQWIAGKRFDGFVTNCVAFSFNPAGKSRFALLPDRDVGISWNLLNGGGGIYPGASSYFGEVDNVMDEQALRSNIAENYAQMQHQYRRMAPGRIRADIASLRDDWDFTVEDLEYRRGQEFGSWDGLFEHDMSAIRTPTRIPLILSKSVFQDIGIIPETREVNSAEELADFALRYVRYQEPGKPFVDDTY